jgi:hypothetical protein
MKRLVRPRKLPETIHRAENLGGIFLAGYVAVVSLLLSLVDTVINGSTDSCAQKKPTLVEKHTYASISLDS